VQPQKQNHQWQQSGPNNRQSPVSFAVAFICSSFIYANFSVFFYVDYFPFAVGFGLVFARPSWPSPGNNNNNNYSKTTKRGMYNILQRRTLIA